MSQELDVSIREAYPALIHILRSRYKIHVGQWRVSESESRVYTYVYRSKDGSDYVVICTIATQEGVRVGLVGSRGGEEVEGKEWASCATLHQTIQAFISMWTRREALLKDLFEDLPAVNEEEPPRLVKAGDENLPEKQRNELQYLRAEVVEDAEDIPLPEHIVASLDPNSPHMLFEDTRTGQRVAVSLYAYRSVRRALSTFLPQEATHDQAKGNT